MTHHRTYAGEDMLPHLYHDQGVSGNFAPPPAHVEVTGEEILASSEQG